MTITSNKGEGVLMEATGTAANPTWIKDGDPSTILGNDLTLPITDVDQGDEGVYECYNNGDRSAQTQAIMRLIIRGIYNVNKKHRKC